MIHNLTRDGKQPIRADVPGYENLYYATSDGRVFSYAKTWINGRGGTAKKPETELKQMLNNDGYPYVHFSKSGTQVTFRIHRIVALIFIPNPENKPEVNHKNGIKLDNRVENLEWASRLENMQHAYKTGLANFSGENSNRAKLTQIQVNEIRASDLKNKELAVIYNVRACTISLIRSYKLWKTA